MPSHNSSPSPSLGLAGLAVAILLVLLLVLAATPAFAAGNDGGSEPGPEATAVELQTEEQDDGTLLLQATLTTADGNPVGGKTLAFYREVHFFVDDQVELGTGITDVTGTATLSYDATEGGSQRFRAHFAGSADLAPSATALSTTLTPPAPQPRSHSRELAGLRRATGLWVTGLTVVAFLLILLLLLHLIWAVPRAAFQPQPDPVMSDPIMDTETPVKGEGYD